MTYIRILLRLGDPKSLASIVLYYTKYLGPVQDRLISIRPMTMFDDTTTHRTTRPLCQSNGVYCDRSRMLSGTAPGA